MRSVCPTISLLCFQNVSNVPPQLTIAQPIGCAASVCPCKNLIRQIFFKSSHSALKNQLARLSDLPRVMHPWMMEQSPERLLHPHSPQLHAEATAALWPLCWAPTSGKWESGPVQRIPNPNQVISPPEGPAGVSRTGP